MKPKEIQKILGIDADRIKLFKREGIFTPENPPAGNCGTNYTENNDIQGSILTCPLFILLT